MVPIVRPVNDSEISKVKKDFGFIDTTIQILRKYLLEQLLLFSETNSKEILLRENRNLVLLLVHCALFIRFANF